MSDSSKRTYVLVHGAYHGGWCWQFVADALRAQGHRVFTPTLPGLGERADELRDDPGLDTFITDIVALFEREDLRDIVLVAHSFGGVVISGVADRVPERIRHLVFLDAVIVPAGSSVFASAPSEALVFYRSVLRQNGGSGAVPVPPLDFFGVVEPAQREFLLQRLTPQPVKPFFDTLVLTQPLGAGLPVTCIHCTAPSFPHAESSRLLARSIPGWRHIDLATGHDAMISAPDDVVAMLHAIA